MNFMKSSLICAAVLGSALLSGCCSNDQDTFSAEKYKGVSPQMALNLLQSGNERYLKSGRDSALRVELKEKGQFPYAVVVTCSDSRDVPEIAFNAGLGEIFTIRTAGNVISDFETGSVEYGVEHLGSPLVVVIGHTSCGAVTAALSDADPNAPKTHIDDIIKEITPSVEAARAAGADDEHLLDESIRLNVLNSIKHLRESHVLNELEHEGKIEIKGAIYDIESGKVTFL